MGFGGGEGGSTRKFKNIEFCRKIAIVILVRRLFI